MTKAATMNIALPAATKQFILNETKAGGFASVSEYIRSLIRAEQLRALKWGQPPPASSESSFIPSEPHPDPWSKE
jgi:hypothetical protein